ncbi:hypothetical protein Mboo_0397 [Methanoregula boonei 6A8]|uniref:Uncharacterized protein n=1 Tax=Methanoregula boonei (strain DSM 21154 / JCM 14090 / 6A8) TaxID=456442 RepID=A7I5A6_METB6|nr:hypothetical protein Mboo_0397 [Methanoregula boonei 6A8]
MGSTKNPFEMRSGQEMAFMRSVKIVRLQKYGRSGLILESGETEPDTGSDGIQKGSSGLNPGPDLGRWYEGYTAVEEGGA